MHCAINAMCEGIPTILLSYSEKSKGIAEFIYENNQWILPLDKIETDLIGKIKSMMEQREEITSFLKEKIATIRNYEQYNESLERIKTLLKECQT